MPTTIPHLKPRPGRLKECRGACGEWLPIECFPRDRQNPDGRRNECRVCRAERRRELRAGAERERPYGLRARRNGA